MRLLSLLFLGACTATSDPDPADIDTDVVDTDTDTDVACDLGKRLSQCLPDFTLPNADGVDISLASFWGDVVMISSGSMW